MHELTAHYHTFMKCVRVHEFLDMLYIWYTVEKNNVIVNCTVTNMRIWYVAAYVLIKSSIVVLLKTAVNMYIVMQLLKVMNYGIALF